MIASPMPSIFYAYSSLFLKEQKKIHLGPNHVQNLTNENKLIFPNSSEMCWQVLYLGYSFNYLKIYL